MEGLAILKHTVREQRDCILLSLPFELPRFSLPSRSTYDHPINSSEPKIDEKTNSAKDAQELNSASIVSFARNASNRHKEYPLSILRLAHLFPTLRSAYNPIINLHLPRPDLLLRRPLRSRERRGGREGGEEGSGRSGF